ncbi:MAG TPA: hypothetical protein VGQ62_08890 [Chloroflexota bacterium]|jgi:hypothetical protein|nr:hypothetical protein [Chloroflexota bacterium]
MPYVNRHATTKKTVGSAELMCLLVVLGAGVATAWWAGHTIGMNLSSISAFASVVGLTETGRLTHGAVGYTASTAEARADQAAPNAAYCAAGQTPGFTPLAIQLQQQIGDPMGAPVECEHAAVAMGDTVQQTTTGLVAYQRLTNTVSFTDGWRHYALTARGLLTWEGTESDPPQG